MIPYSDRPFDIVLWGATGYTGRLVAHVLAHHRDAPKIRLALGGRSKDKLEALLAELSGHSLAGLSLLTGNADDAASLQALAGQAKVVCTTVGPYAKYGSGLVAACVKEGTHYCDLTGEVQWMRRMIDAHHEEAQKTGARIVHTCGFDSIPSDLGVLMLQERLLRQYQKPAVRITAYLGELKGGMSGGTAASMIQLVEEIGRDSKVGQLVANPYALDPVPPPLSETRHSRDRRTLAYDRDMDVLVGPSLMGPVNTRVVRRSHALLDYAWGRDFRYQEVQSFPVSPTGVVRAVAMTGGMTAFMGALMVPPLRKLLAQKLPAPGEGPTAHQRETGYFVLRLLGETASEGGEPLVRMLGVVSDQRDPGYGSTSVMLSESALCLALDELPLRAGVLTPAVAMGMPLIERLRASGLRFEVQPQP